MKIPESSQFSRVKCDLAGVNVVVLKMLAGADQEKGSSIEEPFKHEDVFHIGFAKSYHLLETQFRKHHSLAILLPFIFRNSADFSTAYSDFSEPAFNGLAMAVISTTSFFRSGRSKISLMGTISPSLT